MFLPKKDRYRYDCLPTGQERHKTKDSEHEDREQEKEAAKVKLIQIIHLQARFSYLVGYFSRIRFLTVDDPSYTKFVVDSSVIVSKHDYLCSPYVVLVQSKPCFARFFLWAFFFSGIVLRFVCAGILFKKYI